MREILFYEEIEFDIVGLDINIFLEEEENDFS